MQQLGCGIIGNAHQVKRGAGQLHFNVIVAYVVKLDAAFYIFIVYPVGNAGHVTRQFYLGQIIFIIKPFAGLCDEKSFGQGGKILMQNKLPAYIKQVDTKQQCGDQLSQNGVLLIISH